MKTISASIRWDFLSGFKVVTLWLFNRQQKHFRTVTLWVKSLSVTAAALGLKE